jgi:hypothetical protein
MSEAPTCWLISTHWAGQGSALGVEIVLQNELRRNLITHGLALLSTLIPHNERALGLPGGQSFVPGKTGKVTRLGKCLYELGGFGGLGTI